MKKYSLLKKLSPPRKPTKESETEPKKETNDTSAQAIDAFFRRHEARKNKIKGR